MCFDFVAATWMEKASGLAWAALWFALIFVLIAAVIKLARTYREQGSLMGRWRGRATQDADHPGELLTKFRDLHSRGTLSDVEYRTIKTKLASQIQSDLQVHPEDGSKESDE
jgi:hypothetical protein